MMMDFVNYFGTGSSVKFYPDAFPVDEADELAVIRLLPNYNGNKGGLVTIQVQFIIRANHPSRAESLAYEIIEKHDKNTGFNIGNTRVVLMDFRNPFPMYLGKDANDRFTYSIEAFLIIQK